VDVRRLPLAAKVALAVGSVGLLGALATDAIAVAGRHVRIPLLGSVELVQAFVVIAASAAMVAATLAGGHAVVRIVTDRAPPPVRRILERAADLTGALFFGVLGAGSAWIMWDLRAGAESTELLEIPVGALRALWLISALVATGVFLRRAIRPRSEAPER
jgi:TRAP-type C4-dicarboxylate transport system permease small subunit